MNHIILIVLSGGPCAGKTSALSYIKKELEEQGFLTFTIQEAATELMKSGATYSVCNGAVGFQSCVYELQLAREELFIKIANKANSVRQISIILCDRGTVDCLAYLNDEEKKQFLKLHNTSVSDLLDRYDAVFHLTTVAVKNEKEYSSISNDVRFESLSEAILVDENVRSVWKEHKSFHIIEYETDYTAKIARLMKSINAYLQIYLEQQRDTIN